MAFTGLTDQNLHNELQYHLLEIANNGASYGSGLYTATEIQARLNYRLYQLAKRTGYLINLSNTIQTTANSSVVSIPVDCIDLIHVVYPDINGILNVIPSGSTVEAQAIVTDLMNTPVDVPYMYVRDIGNSTDISQIALLPPPNAQRTIQYLYTARPSALNATPNGTALNIPKEFCPFVKYGALGDIFAKSGETYDAARAQLCQALFDLGADVLSSLVSGDQR